MGNPEPKQNEDAFMTRIRNMSSDIVSRAKIAAAAVGLTFGEKRDVYAALGYKRSLTYDDLRSRYERGDIAGTIVETWPDETWQEGIEVLESEDESNQTTWEKQFIALAKRVDLYAVCRRADILAGIGRYSSILIGAPGNMADELPRNLNPRSIAYLQPHSESSLEVVELENDVNSERWGHPKVYRLKVCNPLGTSRGSLETNLSRDVRWSRVIHIADNTLEDPYFGKSRLERPWNRLDDLDKIAGAGSEAYWRRAHQGTVLSLDPEMEVDSAAMAELKQEADEFEHGQRRVLRARGLKVQQLGSDVAEFSSSLDAIVTLISATTKIPKRILLGSERGELASTQDQENFDRRVMARQVQFAEPVILRQLVDRLMQYGALAPIDYIVHWPSMQGLTPTERAKLAETLSNVNKNMGEIVVTADEVRTKALGWAALQPDQLDPLGPIDGPIGDGVGNQPGGADSSQPKLPLPAPQLPMSGGKP